MGITIEDINNQIKNCEKCELCYSRTNTVAGDGALNSKIMFIGEAPGQSEDETGKPFVGRSGKLLDHLFESIGIDRSKDIYITNILKCRPPKNRDPKPSEQESCINYLRDQYKILRPKIIVCLGRIAAQRLIRSDFSITREHGTWTKKSNTYFTATFHPSALLRNPKNMDAALEDFKEIRAKVLELTKG